MNKHFDTLSAVEALEDAGIASEHARAIIGQMNRAVDENVATKADVKALDTKIDTGLKALDTKIDTGLKALDTKIDTGLKALDTKIDTGLKALNENVATKAEVAEVKGELKAEIAHSTNRAIYTLGGLVTVLFILDRIVPLFGIAQ